MHADSAHAKGTGQHARHHPRRRHDHVSEGRVISIDVWRRLKSIHDAIGKRADARAARLSANPTACIIPCGQQ